MDVLIGVEATAFVGRGPSVVVDESSASLLDKEDPGGVVPYLAAFDEERIDLAANEFDERER